MYIYAQIDDSGVVIGVSQLSSEVNMPGMIRIEEYDTGLLGKRYNADTGEFEDVPQEPTNPEPAPETTDDKLARLEQQNLILMDALATVFEEVLMLGGEEE